MNSQDYPLPEGLHAIPNDQLDLRPDSEVDHDLLQPKPITSEKNIWFFWHSGFTNMHGYTKRNVRAWHRRLSKKGWTIRVLDRVPGSPLNVSAFLDTSDSKTFPEAFINGTLAGHHAAQHTSDLVRFPLLVKYGGVYADAGLLQIGDVDRLWNDFAANPDSPYEVVSYDGNESDHRTLCNYFLVSRRDNVFFKKCHRLLLALWAADGGKTSTEGMHSNPLLKGSPPQGVGLTFEENGRTIGPEEGSAMLTDYIIQGQVMTMVMGTVDEEANWNGPKYAAEHIFAIEFMVGAQLINDLTQWDGRKAFDLMSLSIPKEGEAESTQQKEAKTIVETILQKSFGFKTATGLILRVFPCTLGSLWRDNPESENVPGTYAYWLRHGMIHWSQEKLPDPLQLEGIEPFKRGPLLREA